VKVATLRVKHQLRKLTSIAAALAAVAAFGVAQATPSGAAVLKPNAPTNVSAVAGNAQATVSWKAAVLGGNPSSFTATATPGGQTCTTANGTTLSCTVTGLTNGTSYTFTVIATNSQGSSSASSPSAAVTPATVPGAPTLVAATSGDGQAAVSWVAPVSDGGGVITGYTVTASPGGATCSTTGALSCTVTGLTNGTSYTFTVVATNWAGSSSLSSASSAITPVGAPDAPTNVTATSGNGQATVSWVAPPSDGGAAITGYTVTASPGGATCSTTGVLTCIISGLRNGTSYTFTVVATNSVGNSVASAPSSSATPTGPPGAPANVQLTVGVGQVVVSWSAPTWTGGSAITGYTVTASPGGATCSTTSALTCTVTGLTNGQQYSFAVVATNANGSGEPAQAFGNEVSPGASFSPRSAQILTTTCVSATFCVDGGTYKGSDYYTQAFVSVFNGATWNDTELAGSLNTEGMAAVTSVSCTSATFCVAVGHYYDSSSKVFASVFNGTTWTTSEVAGDINTGGYAGVSSVSCTSATFCVAGGQYENSPERDQAFVSVYNGTTWTDTEVVGALNTDGFAAVNSVSCTSASFCVAGGYYQDSNGNEQAFVSVYNGTTWTDTEVAGALNTGSIGQILSVSCTSAAFCVAGGYYTNFSTSSQGAFVSVYNGTTWTDTEVGEGLGSGNARVNSVSCTSATFCVAGGYYSASGYVQAFVSVYNGTTWTDAEVAGALNATNGQAQVLSVSCTSVSSCVAGGYFTHSDENLQAFVSVFNGTTWTDAEVAGALNTSDAAQVNSVSCTSATFCVAGGYYTAFGVVQAFDVMLVDPSATLPTIPGAPSGVRATPGDGSAVVTWSAPSDDGGATITGYVVTASPGGATCTTTGALSCTVTGLVNGTSYTFTVVATNSVGNSEASTPSASATLVTVPGAPSGVRATPGYGSAVVTWSAPTTDGGSAIIGYVVHASPGGATCTTTGALSCTVTGLVNGTSYAFTVVATNSVGNSEASTRSASATFTTVPGAPSGVSAAPGDGTGTADVWWSAPSDDGGATITGYVVTASPGGATCTTFGATSCPVTGLVDGTSYTFTVTATNAVGAGAPSSPSGAVILSGPVVVAPSAPGTPVLTDNHGSISLSWSAPTSDGGATVTYKVEELTNHGSWSEVATGLTSPSYTYQGTTAKTTYSFAVIAANSAGQSAWSPVAYLKAVAVKPSVPGTPVLTDNHGSFTVTWTPSANNGGDVVTYKVEEQTNSGSWTQVASGLSATSYTYQGTTANNTYCFAVIAVNSAGQSAWSSPSYLRAS